MQLSEWVHFLTDHYILMLFFVFTIGLFHYCLYKLIRFMLSRYGIHTVSFMMTVIIIYVWVLNGLNGFPTGNQFEPIQLLVFMALSLIMFGVVLLIYIAVKSVSQVKPHK